MQAYLQFFENGGEPLKYINKFWFRQDAQAPQWVVIVRAICRHGAAMLLPIVDRGYTVLRARLVDCRRDCWPLTVVVRRIRLARKHLPQNRRVIFMTDRQ